MSQYFKCIEMNENVVLCVRYIIIQVFVYPIKALAVTEYLCYDKYNT